MIGLDTNVLLRLFDRTHPAQMQISEEFVLRAGNHGCLLNPIVLAEFVWTLERSYKLNRSVIADHLDRILEGSEFVVPFLEEAITAAARYRQGPADFADYFLSGINSSLGCSTTATFDRAAATDRSFTLLKPKPYGGAMLPSSSSSCERK